MVRIIDQLCRSNLTIKHRKMENKHFRFKTNINCGGCVAGVTPFLNKAEGVCEWAVDTTSKDKILTVTAKGIDEQAIVETVQAAGFTITPLQD